MTKGIGDKDWGERLRQMLEEGTRIADKHRSESQRLREQVAYLEHELAQSPSGNDPLVTRLEVELDAMRKERDQLHSELSDLKDRLEQIRLENNEFAEENVRIERQNSNFISLYVASTQLHSTLVHDEVLQSIDEILINLIGAEAFAIYLFEPRSQEFRLVSSEGLEDSVPTVVSLGENLLSQVAHSRELYLIDDVTTPPPDGEPIAIQPLVVSDDLVGLLVVHKLLNQKDGFEPLDMELFDLLAGHAATALMSSQLYTRSARKASTLEGLIGLLKDGKPVAPESAGS